MFEDCVIKGFFSHSTPFSFSWQGCQAAGRSPKRQKKWVVTGPDLGMVLYWVYHVKIHKNFTGITIEHLGNWKLSARNCYQIYQKLNFLPTSQLDDGSIVRIRVEVCHDTFEYSRRWQTLLFGAMTWRIQCMCFCIWSTCILSEIWNLNPIALRSARVQSQVLVVFHGW